MSGGGGGGGSVRRGQALQLGAAAGPGVGGNRPRAVQREVMVETEFITGNKPRRKTLLWPRFGAALRGGAGRGAEVGVWSGAGAGTFTAPSTGHCAGRYKMGACPACLSPPRAALPSCLSLSLRLRRGQLRVKLLAARAHL